MLNNRTFFAVGNLLRSSFIVEHVASVRRTFSNGREDDEVFADRFQLIANEHLSTFSSPIKKVVNGIKLASFKRNYDTRFSKDGFLDGSMKVFLKVTKDLLNSKIDDLKPLFTKNAYDKLISGMEVLSNDQKATLLKIDESDVEQQKILSCQFRNEGVSRFFAISICFSCVRDREKVLEKMISSFDKTSFKDIVKFYIKERQEIVANVEFIKKLYPNLDEDWTISYVNYEYLRHALD